MFIDRSLKTKQGNNPSKSEEQKYSLVVIVT
jgi:hypothetical protein